MNQSAIKKIIIFIAIYIGQGLFVLVLDEWFRDLINFFALSDDRMDNSTVPTVVVFMWTTFCLFMAIFINMLKKQRYASILSVFLVIVYSIGFFVLGVKFNDWFVGLYLEQWIFAVLMTYTISSNIFLYSVGRKMAVDYLGIMCTILGSLSLLWWSLLSFVASITMPGG